MRPLRLIGRLLPPPVSAPRATLRRRSLLLTAAAVVPFVLLGAWAVWTGHERLRAEMEGALLDGARVLAGEVDREFERGEAVLATLANSSALHRGDYDAFEGEMRAAARRMGVHIGLALPDGFQALNTIWAPGERRQGVPAPPVAREVFATGRAKVSDLFDGPSDGRPVVALSVPVFPPAGAGSGTPASHVLGFIVPRERFRAMASGAKTHHDGGGVAGGGAAIFDGARRVVAHSRTDAAAVGKPALPDMLDLLARGGGAGIARGRRDRQGDPVVSAFAHAPRAGFAVLVNAPADAFRAPLRRALWRGAAVGAALFAGTAWLAVFCSGQVAAAFRRVSPEALARIGGFGAAAVPSTGLREADDLAAALVRTMAERDRAHAEVKALFDRSPVGMVRVRLDGTVLDANDAYLRMREASRAEMLAGRVNCGENISEDGWARQMAAVAEVVRTGACEPFEKAFVFPDGRRRPVLVVFVLLDRDRDEGAAFVVDLTEQKDAQAALAESEARLARALSAARMATWDWDCATDALRGSHGLEALFGTEPGGVPTRTAALALVHPDDRQRVRATTDESLPPGSGPIDQQYRVPLRDGSTRWLHTMGGVTARDADGAARHASGVLMDVTPLKDEQAKRDQAAGELKALFDASPIGMARATLDGRILEGNDAYFALRGLDRAAPPAGGARWDGPRAPEDAALDAGAVAELRARGRCAPYEKALAHPDGRRVPVLVAAVVLDRERGETASFVVDLSERKRAEAALAASEARLTRALSAARMATWDWDCRTDALRGSAGVEALYGREPGSLPTGADELATVHPDDRAGRAETHGLRGRGENAFDEQYRIVWPDGAVRWLHAIGRVTARDAGGAPLHASGVVMDVTPLKEEQARRDLLIREVDHRAKNVLAVVQAVVKLSAAEDPKEFARIVEGRVAALAHAHTLLARDGWAGADVRALLDEELAPFLAASAGGAGAGGRRAALHGPRVLLSPWAVQPFAMALHELATNAAKYGALGENGGRLDVGWRLDGATGELELRWKETGARQGGAGGAPTRKGFGTRVVDSTVRDQLRGSIARDWTAGGLLCTVRLPAAQLAGAKDASAAAVAVSRPPARRLAAAPDGTLDLRGRRVLVVEDEAVLAQALVASLTALGAEVVGPAGSLEDALRLAATAPGLDAAVLDVNLAGRFSFPVADVLAGRGVPAVFATGYASLPADGIVTRHGAVPLLRKPLADADLAEALREATAGGQRCNRQRGETIELVR